MAFLAYLVAVIIAAAVAIFHAAVPHDLEWITGLIALGLLLGGAGPVIEWVRRPR